MEAFSYLITFTAFLICFINVVSCENVKKSLDENRDDNGDANEETKDESLDIPSENENSPVAKNCTARRQNSKVHELRQANPKEFPFMVGIFSQQNEFLCSGAVVSNGLIATAAHCLQLSVSYILLNTLNDKKDNSTIMLHIARTEKFPTYSANSYSKDVGLIYTEKFNTSVASKLKLSNYTNIHNVAEFEAIGFGLNADVGQVKELQYVGLENRLIYEKGEDITGYLDCIDTKVSSCFRDTGGPAIYDDEMIGIVVKGQEDCTKAMSATYSANKFMVSVLPTYSFRGWIQDRIKKNEEVPQTVLVAYPVKPTATRRRYRSVAEKQSYSILLMHIYIFYFIACVLI